MPFFDGQVQRYEIQSPLGKKFVVVKERDIPFHKGPRIWTRRIVSRSNRLMSAATNSDFVVKKDIYAIVPKCNSPKKLTVLLAILNSSLISFLYLSRSAAAVKDDFRQVTLSGMRELPIIFPDANVVPELVRLVSARERQDGDITDLERRIDAMIYRAYGVTDTEQDSIAAWLARSG